MNKPSLLPLVAAIWLAYATALLAQPPHLAVAESIIRIDEQVFAR